MECLEKLDYLRDASVFSLLTKLCETVLSDYCGNDFGFMDHKLVKRMRSKAYEIILKKSGLLITDKQPEPIMDLISYMYILNIKQRSVQDFCRVDKLKELVDWAIVIKKESREDFTFINILQCLVCLKDTMTNDSSITSFQNPFSFGKLDNMLPKPPKANESDPDPYHYFPSHVFELPYSMRERPNRNVLKRHTKKYFSYDSSLFISKRSIKSLKPQNEEEPQTIFTSSITRRDDAPPNHNYPTDGIPIIPRLSEPRDLSFVFSSSTVPVSDTDKLLASTKSSDGKLSAKYIVESPKSSVTALEHRCHTHAIWEIASAVYPLPNDIWDTVSKMPPNPERNLITMSPYQMSLWKEIYEDQLHQMDIISEVKLVNHLMYLLLGIETTSFMLNQDTDTFKIAPGLCLEGVSQESLYGYLADFLTIGTFYHRLNKIVPANRYEGMLITKGFIFEAMSDKLRDYLLKFGTQISNICSYSMPTALMTTPSALPTLLKILNEIRPMRREIETVAKIHKVHYEDKNDTLPKGARLMAYLYQEVTLITHAHHAKLFYGLLIATCRVYFRFVQRFIFEGELDDYHGEFFIKKDPNYVESPSKRYWDKGFVIRNEEAVPEFAKGLAENILLCGKTFRLLKLCNPEDPLCILLSTEHPAIRCCTTFDGIERQQKLMDVFRTRCLFVCGEPVTFREMLVRKDAERKAFSQLAQVKQTETLQKIVEERKRLQRILNEEKLHCQQMILKAAREAKEARELRGARGRAIAALQDALTQAEKRSEDLIIEDEKKKMIEYYNELGQEVEKRKVRSEWKLKRLKLDEMRVQLLTSEERNFKREKIELKYRNSGIDDTMVHSFDMSLSLYDQLNNQNDNKNRNAVMIELGDSENNNAVLSTGFDYEPIANSEEETGVFHSLNRNCESLDNRKKNSVLSDVNKNPITASDEACNMTSDLLVLPFTDVRFSGTNLEDAYLDRKSEAERNKLKVMCHEFGVDNKTSISELKTVRSASDVETNRDKILGSTCFKEMEDVNCNWEPRPQFNTEESRQALRNKQKMLKYEYAVCDNETRKQRSSLTLDLDRAQKSKKMDWRKLNEPKVQSGNQLTVDSTPLCDLHTPSDVFNQLDLETPTTCDMAGLTGEHSAETVSPQPVSNTSMLRHRVSSDGFTFPSLIIEANDDDEDMDDTVIEQELDNEVDAAMDSPLALDKTDLVNVKSKVWNFTNHLLNFDSFVTCGLKGTDINTDLPFTSQMMLDEKNSCYAPVEDILREAQKKPMKDLYLLNPTAEDDDELCDIANVDFSTLSVCLRRSILIPLTYQMEMVNNAMLKYFLVDLDLYDHLKSLRDYFFLMDAEFSNTICKCLFKKLKYTTNAQELLNFATLHNMLDKAFGSSISTTQKFSANLSFTVTDPPLTFQHSSPDVLQCLTLSYTVPWPLNIILSPEAINRYGRVFQFLVKMRRVSWVLGEDFEELKLSLKEKFTVSRELLRSPQYHKVQIYRHSMASLIRALDNYIVTTCIQTSWKEFEQELMDVHTLDALYTCHVTYIKKVVFRCLLNARSVPLMKVFNELFVVVFKFHHTLSSRCWHIVEDENDYTHPLFSQLKEEFNTFEKLARYLHKITLKLIERGYQPHLMELLTMINMNNFYIS